MRNVAKSPFPLPLEDSGSDVVSKKRGTHEGPIRKFDEDSDACGIALEVTR